MRFLACVLIAIGGSALTANAFENLDCVVNDFVVIGDDVTDEDRVILRNAKFRYLVADEVVYRWVKIDDEVTEKNELIIQKPDAPTVIATVVSRNRMISLAIRSRKGQKIEAKETWQSASDVAVFDLDCIIK